MAARVHRWTTLPPMRGDPGGQRRGGRDPVELPNVVRLVLGEPTGQPQDPSRTGCCWRPTSTPGPAAVARGCLADLLAAGASDAWLTPILMKKGRPAHTLSVLCRPAAVAAAQAVVFAATSTIGLRVQPVRKVALQRAPGSVEVLGGRVGVKVAGLDGQVLNVSVEFEDVAALARRTGLPVKEVLRAATAAAHAIHPGASAKVLAGEGE
ncbi:hypothetical protein A7K94_0217365 [Modestobacter sp. VKM Ac-2676]|nr:hypothetical protein A7K94_0217365 [Modestobacter sp. VKM Ac-2676]